MTTEKTESAVLLFIADKTVANWTATTFTGESDLIWLVHTELQRRCHRIYFKYSLLKQTIMSEFYTTIIDSSGFACGETLETDLIQGVSKIS